MPRPPTHPDNLDAQGKPKFSENSWLILETLREEMADTVGWGKALANQALATKETVDGLKTLTDRLMEFDGIARAAQTAANNAGAKIDAIKAAIILLADRVEQNNLTGLKADIQAALT